ncbi:RNA polymerase sporulation sigma factor SigK [Natranaerobius trueperi]|uniref:RNA polymerase sigma factor n=1 Tax=Natranaerobius trueperi TaxID=759412 RepID=A0A226BZ64_9FIRM|nr:RNA polymerase sporulation sigma factor SigK [Natranaerobius trueperi]OWZ83420.1 RNA polymerase sporulation sigma factor SigK [Natranaerobius trueperi]
MLPIVSLIAIILKEISLLVSYISSNSFPKPLSKEDEKKYLKLLEQGDERAREVLIERNLRLVAHVIKKYENNSGEDTEDLISIGTIGLIKAINTFNSNKGTRLATYAARCIENEILMHFRATKKKRTESHLEDPIGVDKEGNEITLFDILGSDADVVIDQVTLTLDKDKLREIIKTLKPRERKILEWRFGLTNQARMTQKEVANSLGISRSYVSRIEKRVLNKIGNLLESSQQE